MDCMDGCAGRMARGGARDPVRGGRARLVAAAPRRAHRAERAQGEALFRNAADTRKHMEAEYEQARSVMAYLGFTKP